MAAYAFWTFLWWIATPFRALRLYLTEPVKAGFHGIPEPRWLLWIRNTLHALVRIGFFLLWVFLCVTILGGSLAFFFKATGIL